MEPANHRYFDSLLSVSSGLAGGRDCVVALTLLFGWLLRWSSFSGGHCPRGWGRCHSHLLRIHHHWLAWRTVLWSTSSHIWRMHIFCPLRIFLKLRILHISQPSLWWKRISGLTELRLLNELSLLLVLITSRVGRWTIKGDFKSDLAVTFFLADSSSWEEIVIHLRGLLRVITNCSNLNVRDLLLNHSLLGWIVHIYMMTLSLVWVAGHDRRSDGLLVI